MVKPPSLKISPSGVRGIAGDSLTPQLVASFAAAFGTYCRPGEVILGTDTRPSRRMVTQAALAGLLSVGCTPVDIGVVPVPVLQFYTRRRRAAGAVCITASHNPMEWNALKFFGPDGYPLRPGQFAELRDLYHQGVIPRVAADQIQDVAEDRETPIAAHRRAVLAVVDRERIAARRFKVVVDCCNGAAWRASPEFLRDLGCQVVALNVSPDLPFSRNPEPVRAHLGQLCQAVRESGSDLGFAQDADGDRLALVDERGEPLGEDATVALAVRRVLARTPGPVVVSQSTSRMVDEIAFAFGCPVHRSKVGEIHVLEEMARRGAVVGGEGNGGVVVPSINPCRDSFVAMALVLEELAGSDPTLSGLRRRLPGWSIVKRSVACRSRDVAAFLALARRLFHDGNVDLSDGVKIDWDDRWLHVRGSNTEPVLRLVAEARDEEAARELIEGVARYL